MSPDILIKLIAFPVMLSIVYLVTGTETDQSLNPQAASMQRELAGDGATTPSSSSAPRNRERGLKANANDGLGYAARNNYFDFAGGVDLTHQGVINQLLAPGSGLSLVAGTIPAHGDGRSLEKKTLDRGESWPGLPAFSHGSGETKMSPRSCQPYSQIQAIQSRSNPESSNNFANSAVDTVEERSNLNPKLVDPENVNTPSPPQNTGDLNVKDLIGAIATTQQSPNLGMAIAVDDCFIAQAKTVLGLEQVAIAPIKQMPHLAYYDYFSSTAGTTVNLEDGSASYFLFRKAEPSPEQIEKRKQLFQLARESISKWNAF